MRLLWLASYPKSGNTWVRFILHHALFGEMRGSEDVSRRIPDIHRRVPGDAIETAGEDDPVLVKTHFEHTDRLPHAAAALHIVRHPRDVLLSSLNYRRLGGLTEAQMSDQAYAEAFIRAGGDPGFRKLGFGSWITHTESWTHQARVPVLTIRYEDLKADTPGVMETAAEHLGLDLDRATLETACKKSSFDNMRAAEVRERAKTKGGKARGAPKGLFAAEAGTDDRSRFFMHKGASGMSLDERIGPGLDEAFDAVFDKPAAALGY